MSHESHLGPTCSAGTAQEKKAGIGLLLNGALVKDHFYLPTYLSTYRIYLHPTPTYLQNSISTLN